MKQIKKFVPVLLAVIVLSAVFVAPVFAQDVVPPVEPTESVLVEPVDQTADVELPVFDWEKISDALEDLLTAFLIPAVGFAARWLFAKGNVEYSKLTEVQRENFRTFLKVAVYAAEQMDIKTQVGTKLDYVTTQAEIWLLKHKIDIDVDEIRAEIEAIVAREFNMGKILAPSSKK